MAVVLSVGVREATTHRHYFEYFSRGILMAAISPSPIQSLQLARRALAENAPLPDGVLPAHLHRSWERTRATGMRPDDQALFHHAVSYEEMSRIREAHHALIELAMGDLEALWRSMRSPHWVVLLTNTDGTIVHSIGHHELAPRELRLPLRCGRRLLEGEIGTNAPAIVSREPAAIEVRGGEHFLDELHRFSCAAAPIFDLNGQLAGVLNITGFDAPRDARVFNRVRMAALSIESRMYEQAKTGFLISLHEDPRFIGTPAQGLVLAREDGVVLSANRAAMDMLGIQGAELRSALQLSQVFDRDALQRLRDIRAPGECGTGATMAGAIHAVNGAQFYCDVKAQPGTSKRGPSSARQRLRGPDPQWQTEFERASRVFTHGLPVLLQGETGTGKEWFARALHETHRPGKPFVAINCAALAEGVAEAELFGHVEGAYTGSRKGGASGRLEQANGGTLFLDEIGDMSATLQTRLLRVLQERSLTRLGSSQELKLDVLVVSATHRDLAELVSAGLFREDLYFRLNGLKVRLPALRERQDFDALIDACVDETAIDGRPARLPGDVRRLLQAYAWPGNLRQLRHALHVASLLAGSGGEISVDMLPEELRANGGGAKSAKEIVTQASSHDAHNRNPMQSRDAVHREWIMRALAEHGGNISAAAKALGISRTTFYKYRGH